VRDGDEPGLRRHRSEQRLFVRLHHDEARRLAGPAILAVTDRLGLTVGGQTLPLMAEVGLVLAFGVVMLGIAIWSLRRPA